MPCALASSSRRRRRVWNSASSCGWSRVARGWSAAGLAVRPGRTGSRRSSIFRSPRSTARQSGPSRKPPWPSMSTISRPRATSWRNTAPLLAAEFLADAPGAEPIVAELAQPLALAAHQHLGEVRGAEALAGAVDAGQRLLRRDRAVEAGDRLQAGV